MRILINGAGVAGLSAGIDLATAGHDVEIVERAGHLRVNGAPIDVRGESIETARRMGILGSVRAHRITMTEETRFLDRAGVPVAPLVRAEVDESSDDVEIPREDLMSILCAALPAHAQLRFEDSIVALTDSGDHVAVTFASGREGPYDLVVGADGLHSTVRRLVFGPEEEFVEHLGVNVALASAPGQARSDDRTTEILNLPGRLAGVGRYRDQALALFQFRAPPIGDHRDLEANKHSLAQAFADIEDWKVPELLQAAVDDPELYIDAIALVDMPAWHRGRTVLIGDAAYCASPMAGRGASLALLGSWALTEELDRHENDLEAACSAYRQRLLPHVTAAHEFARGGADLIVPASWEAIEARNARLREAQVR